MQVGLRPRLRARSSLLDLVRARNEADNKSKEALPSPLSSPARSPLLSLSSSGLFLGGPPLATGAASTEGTAAVAESTKPTGASPAATATSSAPPQRPRLASAAALDVPLPNSPPSSPHPPPTPPAPSSRVSPPPSSAASPDSAAKEPDAAHVSASSKMAPVRPPPQPRASDLSKMPSQHRSARPTATQKLISLSF